MAHYLPALLATLILSLTLPSFAQSSTSEDASPVYVAGTHYQVLDVPVRTSNPQKVEATELFWYGCSHCFTFEPIVNAWEKNLADDVVFVRNPASWHPSMILHSRAFYTAKVLGVLDRMHPALFEAMNIGKNRLANEAAISDLFVANGVDPEKFSKTFNSFGVNSAVTQAEARQRSYQIKGTPEMIVNGKYRVSAKLSGGHAGMIKVVNYLIELERKALAAKNSAS